MKEKKNVSLKKKYLKNIQMNHNTQQKRCKIIEISNLFVFEEQNNFEKILCQKNMTEEKNTQQSDEKKI